MRGRKGVPYEGSHRVPCFIRWPGSNLRGPRDIAQLTAHLDLLPTLIEFSDLIPLAIVRLDGTSLVPLLTGRADQWPDRTLCARHQELPFPEKWRFCSVITDRWRRVNDKGLYDITADPGQQHGVGKNMLVSCGLCAMPTKPGGVIFPNGSCAVDIAQAGTCKISIRRW